MQSSAILMSDIKALLTLWLLKTGMTPAEIRTSLQLAAASRAMASDEQAYGRPDTSQTAANVARLYPNSEAEVIARKAQQAIEAVNSDVMALITLSLLKVGTSSDEIQKALRLAALSRALVRDENTRASVGTQELPDPLGGGPASIASKQAALNELLVPGLASA
jgi:hypothetical protein